MRENKTKCNSLKSNEHYFCKQAHCAVLCMVGFKRYTPESPVHCSIMMMIMKKIQLSFILAILRTVINIQGVQMDMRKFHRKTCRPRAWASEGEGRGPWTHLDLEI